VVYGKAHLYQSIAYPLFLKDIAICPEYLFQPRLAAARSIPNNSFGARENQKLRWGVMVKKGFHHKPTRISELPEQRRLNRENMRRFY